MIVYGSVHVAVGTHIMEYLPHPLQPWSSASFESLCQFAACALARFKKKKKEKEKEKEKSASLIRASE